MKSIIVVVLLSFFSVARAGVLDAPSLRPIPTALITGPQAKVAVTGTAVQLSGVAVPSGNVICTAPPANAANIYVGPSSVTNTTAFAGVGQVIAPGGTVAFYISNTSAIWINGTAGDGITCSGS
jgi:hypothetical protein